jgi:hypothetical protein
VWLVLDDWQQRNGADDKGRPAGGDTIALFSEDAERDTIACIDVGNRVLRYVMGSAVNGIFDSVGEFADLIHTNHLAVGEMQICGLGRIFDLERKGKRYLRFAGTTVHSDRCEAPLANRLHCGIQKERIAGNGLQVGNGTVNSNDQGELDDPFGVCEPSLSWVNCVYDVQGKAAQFILPELNAGKLRARGSALVRYMRKENQEQEMLKSLGQRRGQQHETLIAL